MKCLAREGKPDVAYICVINRGYYKLYRHLYNNMNNYIFNSGIPLDLYLSL